ncbi:MAG: anti-sigma factor [Pseudomonadota bacterium]
MKLDDEELQSQLAAEYVLGTLQGAARRRLEHMLPAHAGLREKVAHWEQQLGPLASSLTPQPVPSTVWSGINKRLHPPRQVVVNGRFWQRWAWASTALAASLAALLVLTPNPVPRSGEALRDVAVLASDNNEAHWIVRSRANNQLQLSVLGRVTVASDKSLELWAIPANGKPQSLGVLTLTHGHATLALSAMQKQSLSQATLLAVSIETRGGSATGLPTGPVIFTGKHASGGV